MEPIVMLPNVLAQLQEGIDHWVIVVAVFAVIVTVAVMLFALQFFSLWLQAFMSNARVSVYDLIGMRFRKVDARIIVMSKIRAVKAGLGMTTNDLETHYLAGGHVPDVISSLIAADRARIDLPFRTACAIDLAGRDMLDAVHTSVTPKVIDCPDPSSGKTTIDGVAKDGIQVKARARVTVRTSIERLIGGATEETIIARVGEGIVTSIGSSKDYMHVLENPDTISKWVLEKGLDSGTAFEILSIDIADVDVGTNVGAQLQADQAEADMRRFQAEAEQRAAMARAREAEMSALVEENRAKVVAAEAAVPLGIAGAFRRGNL
jgi:uncharacterized protein YqfA (UPF0365 family)